MVKRGIVLLSMIIVLSWAFVGANTLDIEVGNSYSPGDRLEFKVVLYDDQNVQMQDVISYSILNYYTDVVSEGRVSSGDLVVFALPTNSIRGHWAIIVKHNDIEKKEIFDVLELEKADISLEENELIITNIGNTPYQKQISISIGTHAETILVPLAVGQEKRIKLTAPDGNYDIRVNDGTEKEDTFFSNVPLTGNVIGLERIGSGSLMSRYPLVFIFLVILGLIFVIVLIVRTKGIY